MEIAGAFEDPDVTHVEGEVDPVRDLDIISEELRLKDVETLEKLLEKMERTVVRANDKKLKPEYVSCTPAIPMGIILERHANVKCSLLHRIP